METIGINNPELNELFSMILPLQIENPECDQFTA